MEDFHCDIFLDTNFLTDPLIKEFDKNNVKKCKEKYQIAEKKYEDLEITYYSREVLLDTIKKKIDNL